MTSFSDMLSFLKTKFQEVYTYVSSAITQAITDHNTAVAAHPNGFNHDVKITKSNTVIGTTSNNAGSFVVFDKDNKFVSSIITTIDGSGYPRMSFNVANNDNTGTMPGFLILKHMYERIVDGVVKERYPETHAELYNYLNIQRDDNSGADPLVRLFNNKAVIPTTSDAYAGNYGQIRFHGRKGSATGEKWARMGIDCDESVTTYNGVEYRVLKLELHVFSYSLGIDLGETLGLGTKAPFKIMVYMPLKDETRNKCFVRIQAYKYDEGTSGKYYDLFNGFKTNPLG